MELDLKVIARTFETDTHLDDEDLYVFGGKMAGVCYMPENYFDEKIQNEEAAIRKANITSGSGHHSVFEHGSYTFQISGLPKIMAMILNSTEQYTTSEKSARYTVMKPETELELQVYEKWRDIFETVIADKYGDNIDEKTRKKLALENARYLISVFTPTHMTWTVNYRQVAYVIGWLKQLAKDCSKMEGDFNTKLTSWCTKLSNAFMAEVGSYNHLSDNKNRKIEFLPLQSYNTPISDEEVIGDTYQVHYLATFSQLAQEQRHRTIHYEMEFSGKSALEYGIFIPPIIANTPYEAEWKADFEKVAYCYPQGTLVKVLEQGRAIKFFEKSKERLCGRAQLEIMQQTIETMNKFLDHRGELSTRTRDALGKVTNNWKVCSKCQMSSITCSEHCMWGGKDALTRLI